MATETAATRRVALFNDTRSDSHFGCSLVMQQIVAELALQAVEVDWFWPVGRDWHGAVDWREAERSLDGIVVNGEGTIHHSGERPRARWLAELAPFVRRETSLPIFLINATVDSIDSTTADNLKSYDGIFVRDSRSQRLLAGYGVASRVVPDMTLLADFAIPDRGRSGVCATDSVVPELSAVLKEACRRHGWRYRPLRFAGKRGRPKPGRYLADGPWFLLSRFRNHALPKSFAAFTARFRLVVTGRYHMVAYCVLTRTPFVALESNTPKVSALLEDIFGGNDRLITAEDLAGLDPDRFGHWTPAEAAAIERFLAAGRAAGTEMFATMRAAFDLRAQRSAPMKEAS